jgi:chromosome segregation ATPase
MSEMQGEMDEMLRRLDAKNIKTDILEKELRKLQNQHRETLTQWH